MSTWYRTGTIALTNGNATVTGTGTAWIANASIGEGLIAPDGRVYEITAIASNTSLTISPAYLGSTASGQAYAVAPLRGRIAQLLSETSSLIASFAGVRDGIGAGLFPNGTAAAPAIRASADQDTGLFFPAANMLALSAGGIESMRITPNGAGVGTNVPEARLHVNAGPSAINTSFTGAGQLFNLQLIAGNASVINSVAYSLQLNRSGAINAGIDFRRGSSGENGSLGFVTNNIEQLRIASDGNVGIGTTAPSERLSINAGAQSLVYTSWGTTGLDRLRVGYIAGATRKTIDSAAEINSDSNGNLNLSSRPNLSTANIDFFTSSNGTTSERRLRLASTGTVRPGADNTQSLGEASFRWSTVFSGTGTINTSDEREKVWRGELNEDELRAAKRIIGELGIYQWAESYEEKGKDARLHFGVRAQRAFDILKDEGLDWWRYAWCCHDKWDETTEPVIEDVTVEKTRTVTREDVDPETGEPVTVEVEETYEEVEQRDTGEVRVVREAGDRYGIRPDQLAFWLIAAQAAMQADLDARLTALEGKKK